jgi:hypothetical protein
MKIPVSKSTDDPEKWVPPRLVYKESQGSAYYPTDNSKH